MQDMFLRLPIQSANGEDWQFVKIDPRRYNITTASTFYRKTKDGPGNHFRPATRKALSLENIPVPLLEQLTDEVFSELSNSLRSDTSDQEVLSNGVFAYGQKIKQLIYALSSHDLAQAQSGIRQLAEQLGVLLLDLLAQSKTAKADAEAYADLASEVTASVVSAKKKSYREWACSARSVLEVCQVYEKNFSLIEELATESETALWNFQVGSEKPQGIIQNAIQFLDPKFGEGFVSLALIQQNQDIVDESFLKTVNRAKEIIRECDE